MEKLIFIINLNLQTLFINILKYNVKKKENIVLKRKQWVRKKE